MAWRLLLLLAAAAAAASSTLSEARRMSSRTTLCNGGAFVCMQSQSLQCYYKRCTHEHFSSATSVVLLHSSSTPMIPLAMSSKSLQDQIIDGATMKLLEKDSSTDSNTRKRKQRLREAVESKASSSIEAPIVEVKANGIPTDERQYTYYVREGRRSEIDAITDALMDSFHPNSQYPFDSYIRRYKYNHLKMCFDAIDECDRGLFVACATIPTESTTSSSTLHTEGEHKIIGFCSVDGRAPDPSCKLENLSPSTLAGTSPRPYLSDLGVSTIHRRKGIGVMLVQACEQWTHKRGYDKLYLKVEKENASAYGLYRSMGYRKTKIPWGNDTTEGGKWGDTLLMDKSIIDGRKRQKKQRKRTWLKYRLWTPLKNSVDRRYAAKISN